MLYRKIFTALFIAALCLTASPTLAQVKKCSANDIKVTTTPIPPQRSWAHDRLDRQKAKLTKPVDVVFLGDSLIERWPQVNLDQLFPNQKVINLGLGSDLTQTVLWRLENMDYTPLKPRRAVLWLGTNNIGQADPCAIAVGLERVLDSMQQVWPQLERIDVMKIIPKGLNFQTAPDKIAELNAAIDAIVATNPAKYRAIEPMPGLTCGVENRNWFENMVGSLSKEPPCANYEKDFLHLTPQGYQAMHDYLIERLK